MSTFSLRIVIADDHPAILIGNRQALQAMATIEVVATVRNSSELIAVLETENCDILVTDYSMPGGEYGDGMALFEFIQRRYPALKIVIMTMLDSPIVLRPLIRSGIRCILSKSDDSTHLIPAIHVASAGGSYFSPTIAAMAQELENNTRGNVSKSELTKRELEILRYYTSGLSVTEIAEVLSRSKQTISSQKSSAMKKLGIEREADLFKYAMEMGLISSSQ
ncbi:MULTISPECIES: response regulator transcription factor [unclassified Undibacterium]|uniref:response regulator transcription factor n=1 Tax=unclassified Undibacterium TaxID=2630295 RepID=UPI002AC91B31|nr:MULTISPECIES: response regulator transcription factor [unclassified Undibacterium]MEB0140262.1 response regulator transcription factor [Undibacterium sp. CCC2.1]MEB0173324.1 response regulator transcription factor [Undibacterium sp. CCC1.1]MEB0177143.1 response regulator transcription factor [Undibacterium sp. CCC3.4]MEB0216401.1 response regulator transcription factor [Undibacterium sp. 5I2]WPX45544.1 response regulator transcription factor [Undibacterium sp. CCC3.4]